MSYLLGLLMATYSLSLATPENELNAVENVGRKKSQMLKVSQSTLKWNPGRNRNY